MSDFHALHKDSKVDATDAPGQTFLSLTGEGGTYGDDGADTELCEDREPFEAWWAVTRPPDNSDFEETEYVVTRLGGNDVVPHASRNIKISAAVRSALGADLAKGEVCLYTSDGTNSVLVHLDPAGHVNIITSGDISLDPTGEVKIGGGAATDYVTLFNALKTDFDAFVLAYNTHNHPTAPPGVVSGPSVPGVNLTNGPRSTKGRAI